jgi:1-acyl-sn-glycerol-3-phosphate acyltransferase
MARFSATDARMSHPSQFSLLGSRRFLPFFLTQGLGAFNDNVFRSALVVLIAFKAGELSSAEINLWSNIAAGLFILPFFLFSATAGQWAEKYEKSRSIRRIKLLEIGIMALATIGFALNSIPFLIGVLFLMGTQSTLFGPIKFAILPQHLKPEELVGGNAMVEAGTFLTILIGFLVGGLLAGFPNGPLYASVAVLLVAVMGYVTSRHIPEAPATDPGLAINWNSFSETWRILRFLGHKRAVLNSVLGISWFWFFGSIFLAQMPNYTKEFLGGNEQVAPLVLAVFSLGIGTGSLLCEKLSGRRVEIGLVPLGAIGLTLFGIDLFLARPEAATAVGLGWREFLAAPGNLRILFDLLMIGIFGGFYIVPLYALIQTRAERSHLSRVIAANNILNALFMVVATIMAIALFQFGFNIPEVLLVTAVLNALVAIYIFSLVPEFVARFLSWLIICGLYRIRTDAVEKLPDEGAAVVVCNHVAYTDALILMGSIKRPVRFVMYHKIFKIPVLSWLFRSARCIPIAPAKEDPALMEKAFAEIDAALAAGEVIGIFPEGALTQDGEISTFRPGIERILAARPVPVLPLALRGMWDSMWSRQDSKLRRARLPRRFRAHIELVAGELVPAGEATAAGLEATVRELRGAQA